MIDPKDVTFTTGNVHIPNSYRYNRKAEASQLPATSKAQQRVAAS